MDNHVVKESLDHNASRYPNTHNNNNNTDVNLEKIISLDTNDVRVYDREVLMKSLS